MKHDKKYTGSQKHEIQINLKISPVSFIFATVIEQYLIYIYISINVQSNQIKSTNYLLNYNYQ